MNEKYLALEQEEEALNENTHPERLDELADVPHLAALVAENVNTSPETFTKLAINKNEDILKAIVRNPSTPTEILIELGSLYPQQLVKNPIVDLWLLEDNNPFLYENTFKKKLACNRTTPVKLLKILARDSDSNVRLEVVKNPNIPVSLLEILARDSDSNVRLEVVKNPNIPVSLLEILAYDYDPLVCDTTSIYFVYRVLTDDNTPVSLLQKSVNQLKHNKGFLSLL
ncbi:HEAT repeat domain-containing protein [Crocosphaera sp.]|uniref:HEAT repeat domain-containing protein n=1 Tax=Crocosphaera sp. TaxID=2729996 RepID=UPI00263068F3|nr:HEAT repeat domain-containing protein [Crocosphaera sp.]MDJ0581254.1 HEAT repeat domain-containing protein [Crocosphaera sp.]